MTVVASFGHTSLFAQSDTFSKVVFYVLRYKWLQDWVYQLPKLFQHICESSYFSALQVTEYGKNRIDPPCLVNEGDKVTVVETRYRN